MTLYYKKKHYDIAGYKTANNGYAITLDGQRINTHGGLSFIVPSEELASAIAKEWNSQDKHINPATMPITALCCTALDFVSLNVNQTVNELLHYAETDLLCYRSDDSIQLKNIQNTYWQPLLEWIEKTYDSRFSITSGIVPIKQSQDTILKLRRVIESLDHFHLTALTSITKITGSLIIGLCVVGGEVNANDALEVSQVDENWQRKKWGEDPEEMKRLNSLNKELFEIKSFLDLIINV